MKYYSTNGKVPPVSLREAVTQGLAGDNGLFMPERFDRLPDSFFDAIDGMSLQEISLAAAQNFFGEDIPADDLRHLVYDTLQFEIPLRRITDRIYALELFHGPTMAFKDVGARFMARLLAYFTRDAHREINVLVATSGDTGSAVANGFYNVPGIKVFVLYPKGRVSTIQEKQFTTLGGNVSALEVEGAFDDCQRMVKEAFLDRELNEAMTLTSANSINLARLLPQSFYYYHGFAQMPDKSDVVCCVPSGNFGNICAGLIAKRTGLPIRHFIAGTNVNDVFPEYIRTGLYKPRASVATIANAMDVGNPSNFVRITDLYGHSHEAICRDISSYAYRDSTIRETIREVRARYGYLLDPHGAVGFKALEHYLASHDGTGFFIETAHPAKFTDTVEEIIGEPVPLPPALARFSAGRKQTTVIPATLDALKQYMLS